MLSEPVLIDEDGLGSLASSHCDFSVLISVFHVVKEESGYLVRGRPP